MGFGRMVIGCIERSKGIVGCESQDLAEMPERAGVAESTPFTTEGTKEYGGIHLCFSVSSVVKSLFRKENEFHSLKA